MRILLPAAAVLLLAACAADGSQTAGTAGDEAVSPSTATASAAPAGPTFEAALTEAYGALAQFESRAGSPEDAAYFTTRRDLAAAGTAPTPEPAPSAALQGARQDLLAALTLRGTMPVEAATAQAAYDCWANDARNAAEPVPVDCPRLFRDTMQELAAAR